MGLNSRRSRSTQAGFTLVEILVGLGIGLLATVVIIQVMSVFEVQRRTTTGTADAQTNGGIALYVISRELSMAGYPLLPVTNSALECTALTINGVADATVPIRVSPVAVADGVSDAITMRYGTSIMGGVPTQFSAAPVGNVVAVISNLGCAAGDIALITSGTTCAITTATAVTGNTVPNMTLTLANTTGAATGANVACMGTWNEVTYRVNAGNLERCVLATAAAAGGDCNPATVNNANFIPSVAGVVNLQVQYGVSAAGLPNSDPNFNQIVQWVDAKTVGGLNWAAPAVVDRNRIKALRLAVVARNAKKELAVVPSSTVCSSLTAAAPTGLCAWAGTAASPAPAIDVSADANWQYYRYRVFETIIPLRNIIWARDTL